MHISCLLFFFLVFCIRLDFLSVLSCRYVEATRIFAEFAKDGKELNQQTTDTLMAE